MKPSLLGIVSLVILSLLNNLNLLWCYILQYISIPYIYSFGLLYTLKGCYLTFALCKYEAHSSVIITMALLGLESCLKRTDAKCLKGLPKIILLSSLSHGCINHIIDSHNRKTKYMLVRLVFSAFGFSFFSFHFHFLLEWWKQQHGVALNIERVFQQFFKELAADDKKKNTFLNDLCFLDLATSRHLESYPAITSWK